MIQKDLHDMFLLRPDILTILVMNQEKGVDHLHVITVIGVANIYYVSSRHNGVCFVT